MRNHSRLCGSKLSWLRRASILPALVAAWLFAPRSGLLAEEVGAERFIRGDANLDARVTLADVFSILRYIGLGATLTCRAAADVDDSGSVNPTDAIYLLGSIFYRHGAPPEPFARPGPDPTPDHTGCWKGLDLGGRLPDAAAPQGGGGGQADELGDGDAGCGDDEGGPDLEFIHFREAILAAPGESFIRVPLYYRSKGGVEGLTVSFHASPEWLRLERIRFAPTVLDLRPDWVHQFTQKQDSGYISSSLAISLAPPFRTLPATEGAQIAVLELSVRPDTPVGTRIPVRFVDTPGENGMPPIRNELSRTGKTQIVPFCGLVVEVVSPRGLFVRGDANGDRNLDVHDVALVLRHLFAPSAETKLPCADACDFDDDGAIRLNDPVALLNYLFRRGEAPAYPFPQAGRDSVRPDGLGCLRE